LFADVLKKEPNLVWQLSLGQLQAQMMLLPNDSEQVCKGFHRQTPGLEPCQTFGDHKNWPIKQKLRLAE